MKKTLYATEFNINNFKIQRYHYDEIDSTQLEARRVSSEIQLDSWYLCTANQQTNGIGQHSRTWDSPQNVNIYATYGFLIPEIEKTKMIFMPQVTCLSIVQTLESYMVLKVIISITALLLRKIKVGTVQRKLVY